MDNKIFASIMVTIMVISVLSPAVMYISGTDMEIVAPDFGKYSERPETSSKSFVWSEINKTETSIVKFTGDEKLVVIPDIIDSRKVTTICAGAFSGTSAEIVHLSANVKTFQYKGETGAFSDCTTLKKVIFPDGIAIRGIENFAFKGCTSLTEISLPVGLNLKYIGSAAFESSGLVSMTFPASLESVQYRAFNNCVSLKSVTFNGKNLNNIGNDAFKGCTSLESVNIPKDASSSKEFKFGSSAFKDCTSLAGISIPNSVKSINSSLFENCASLKNVELPYGLTSIGISAFQNSGLKSISIPHTIIEIKNFAFSNCKDLASVNFFAVDTDMNGLKKLGNDAFRNCDSLQSIWIPSGTESIGSSAFRDCNSLISIILPTNKNFDEISANLFSGCKNMESVVVPESVNKINYGSFIGMGGNDNAHKPIITILNPNVNITDSAFPQNSNYEFIISDKTPDKTAKYLETRGNVIKNPFINILIYHSNGGSDPAFHVISFIDETVSLTKSPKYVRDGNIFSKWMTMSYGGEEYDPQGTFVFKKISDGNQTANLYVKWTPEKYTVTWISEGNVLKENIQKFGDKIIPYAPVRTGYTLVGWDPAVISPMPAKPMTYTAIWTPNMHQITWNDGSEIKYEKVAYGSKIIEPICEKPGYTCQWSPEIPDSMPDKDLTFNGTYVKKTFKIEWMVNGAVYEEQLYEFEKKIIPPNNPSSPGKTFVGWNPNIPETMPAKDLAFTAEWSDNQYSITYNLGNGTQPIINTYNYGDPINKLPDPSRYGYNFVGWNSTIPETMPAKDLAFTAEWTLASFSITWVVDGKETVENNIPFGTSLIGHIPEDPVKDGNTFSGWSPQVPDTMPGENVIYTAMWTPNTYKITWNVDGKITSQDIGYGSDIVPPKNPEKQDWRFVDWSPNVPKTMPAKDLAFTATWERIIYNVTFHAGQHGTFNGNPTLVVPVMSGMAVDQKSVTPIGEYNFTGWYLSENTEIIFDFNTSIRKDTDLYAKWTPAIAPSIPPYVLLVNDLDGGSMKINLSNTGKVILPTDAFQADGFTLSGWSTGTEGSGNVYSLGQEYAFISGTVLHAVWKIGVYNEVQEGIYKVDISKASASKSLEVMSNTILIDVKSLDGINGKVILDLHSINEIMSAMAKDSMLIIMMNDVTLYVSNETLSGVTKTMNELTSDDPASDYVLYFRGLAVSDVTTDGFMVKQGYDIIMYAVDLASAKYVSFDAPVTVTVDYNMGEDDDPKMISVLHVNRDGNICGFLTSDFNGKTATFSTMDFSYFLIGYQYTTGMLSLELIVFMSLVMFAVAFTALVIKRSYFGNNYKN